MKGLKHAALPALDLRRAQSFYRALGFTDYHTSDADWLMMSYRETTLSLIKMPASWKAPESKGGEHPSHLGLLANSIAEVDSLWKKLSQNSALALSKPKLHRDQSYGFYFHDSEGNNLEFIYIPVLPVFEKLAASELSLILVHGSRRPEWLESFEKLLIELEQEDPRRLWKLASLEGVGPKILEVTEPVLAQGEVRKVRLIPLLFSKGKHLSEDIQQALAPLRATFPEVEWSVAEALMEDEFFRSALKDYCLLKTEEDKK
jgi:predicted lactoylglutathione lyase